MAGVRSILNRLNATPTSDGEVKERLALVDYLRYRLRWDENLSQKIEQVILKPIDESASPRYQAPLYAEKSELLGALAQKNWDSAAQTLTRIQNQRLKKIALVEAYLSLLDSGLSREEAKIQVQKITPDFQG